jgi:hypothetical protein
MLSYRNPNLGLVTKIRGCKVTGQEGDPKVTSHALESAKSVREWTLTLPSELPLWELESQMESQIFRVRLQGLKPSIGRVIYIIGKLMKHKCLKWAHITHLDIWNTSYDQKKGRESNQLLKVGNRLNSVAFKQHATYRCKALDEGYNFTSNLVVIGSLHIKLWGPKVARISTVGISKFPLGSPETKTIWMWP